MCNGPQHQWVSCISVPSLHAQLINHSLKPACERKPTSHIPPPHWHHNHVHPFGKRRNLQPTMPHVCTKCHCSFDDDEGAANHLVKSSCFYFNDIRSARDGVDNHGHMYYCFECPAIFALVYKSHRSFDSAQAILDHARDEHRIHFDRK
jgi:hypothetical protein